MSDHPELPTPGFYLWRPLLGKLPNGRNEYGDWRPVRIAREVTPDPELEYNTQDRSPVLHCYISEQEIDWFEIWPWCAGNKITEDAYWNFVIAEREE